MTHDSSRSATQTIAEQTSSVNERLHSLEAQVTQLEESARQAALSFEHLPTPSLLLDAQGQIVGGNLRSHELLGAMPGTLLGRSFTFFLDSASQGTFSALLDRARKSDERIKGEGRLRMDIPHDVLLEVAPHGSGWLLTMTDVSAFKEAHRQLMDRSYLQEQRLRDANAELRQLTEEFEQVIRLSEQQLHNQLTRARNFLALHQKTEQPLYLTHVEATLIQAQNLLTSVNQYMQLRFMRTRVRRVKLDQVWNDVVKGSQHERQGRNVHITRAPLPTLMGDSQVFKIILGEFVLNALKFTRMREETHLQLLVEETDREYQIGVRDNGIGFNMRQKERAFEMFSRLHADDRYEGTGLGLTVVRRLCERFGARVWGEGRTGEGATFWFSWPKETPGN